MNATIAITGRSLHRVAVESAVWLLLAALLVETWLVKGILPPCRVSGGSMAESFPGRRRCVVCADCGFAFSCGVDRPPLQPRAVCPNCGYADNDLAAAFELAGRRLLIRRAAFLVRGPRRWEVVALRQPTQAEKIAIKRVVGLPGETIEIRGGDVYVNGLLSRKSLAEQRGLVLPVHDSAHRPRLEPAPPPRWRPAAPDSRWEFDAGSFRRTTAAENEPIDWLVYHHRRRRAGEFVESPIQDLYGYNQSRPRRDEDVHAVADLLLSFWLTRVSPGGTVYIRASDGGAATAARLRFDGDQIHCEALHADHPTSPSKKGENTAGQASSGTRTSRDRLFQWDAIPGAAGSASARGCRHLIEVSLIDGRFLLAIDGRTVFDIPLDRSAGSPSPSATPFAVGVQGLAASLDGLRIWRDIYYTNPIGSRPRGPVRLAADEYFVLGDNSPVSEDSRHWPDGGVVNANLLLGKVLDP